MQPELGWLADASTYRRWPLYLMRRSPFISFAERSLEELELLFDSEDEIVSNYLEGKTPYSAPTRTGKTRYGVFYVAESSGLSGTHEEQTPDYFARRENTRI